MKIEIIDVTVNHTPTAKGGYNTAEVSFKADGKVQGKKIMSFGHTAEVYKILSVGEQKGKKYDVHQEKIANPKDGKEYWTWLKLTPDTGNSVVTQAPTPSPGTVGSAATRTGGGSWETAEERAARQVLIVKQSSLERAIDLLTVGAKAPPSRELVLKEAQAFADWVLGIPVQRDLFDQPNDLVGEVE
jgi:hypothetical protein